MAEPGGSLHVVFGATGAIGGTVVTELLHAGRTVRAVSRGGQAPDGAQGVAADPSDRAQAARAAAGAAVIYHCASPPSTQWPKLFPALTGSILGAAESSGAKLSSPTTCTPTGQLTGPCARTCPLPQVAARAGPGWKWPPSCSARTATASNKERMPEECRKPSKSCPRSRS